MNLQPSAQGRNPYLRAESLGELLAWQDVDFVRCAYVTILGRQPDPRGEQHFTSRLRMGDSKYAIIWKLRRSEEGADHDPGIAGLDRALKKEALRRNRLFGWLIRAIVPGEGTSRQDRRSLQLQNMLALIAEQQSRQTEAMLAVRTDGNERAISVDKIAGILAQLADQVESISSHFATHQSGNEPAVASDLSRPDVSDRTTDDLDLSSRERAIILSLASVRY